jgi:anti-sigma factor RsiW
MIPWITCEEVVGFLDAYLAQALDAEATARFERHLSECPPCVTYMHTYQDSIRMGRAALAPTKEPVRDDVPEDLVQAILRARDGSRG